MVLRQIRVNAPTAKCSPATRSSAMAWEETSMMTYWHPASAIRRSSCCSSKLSGVVRSVGMIWSPISLWIVPIRPTFLRRASAPRPLFQDRCHRRLAVCPGDADELHAAGRIAKPVGRDLRQRRPRRRCLDIGAFCRGLLAQHGSRAIFQRHGDKPVPIGGKAGHTRQRGRPAAPAANRSTRR